MRFGVGVPTGMEGLFYSEVKPDWLVKIIEEAESLGFDSAWANDHLTTPLYLKRVGMPTPHFFDSIVTLSKASATTNRIKLGTAVIALPLRNPVILAKQIATLDVLSGGRAILGVGLGSYQEEFTSLFPTMPPRSRSRIFDESLTALSLLFTQSPASIDGKYVKFSNVELSPKPLQNPMPIWIGGNSRAVPRRVAKYGQGWVGASLAAKELVAMRSEIMKAAEKEGRVLSSLEIGPQYSICISKDRNQARKRFLESVTYKHLQSLQNSTFKNMDISDLLARRPIGNPDDIIAKLEELGEAGVNHPILIFVASNLDELIYSMKLFSEQVSPSFR